MDGPAIHKLLPPAAQAEAEDLPKPPPRSARHVPSAGVRATSRPPSPAPPSSSKEVPKDPGAVSQKAVHSPATSPPRLEHRAANPVGSELSCVLSESRHGQALPKPDITDLNHYPKRCRSCCFSFGPLISEPAAASLQASLIDSFQQQISTAPRARPSRGGSLAFWLPQESNPRVRSN